MDEEHVLSTDVRLALDTLCPNFKEFERAFRKGILCLLWSLFHSFSFFKLPEPLFWVKI